MTRLTRGSPARRAQDGHLNTIACFRQCELREDIDHDGSRLFCLFRGARDRGSKQSYTPREPPTLLLTQHDFHLQAYVVVDTRGLASSLLQQVQEVACIR